MAYLGAGLTRFNTADELTVTGDAQIDTNTLVVDSTNNRVGILNASPATALDVTGTVTADDIVLSDADAPSITLTDTTNTLTTLIQSGNSTAIIGTTTNHDLRIYTNNTEAMRIDSAGSVGIGTSSPTSYGNSQATLVVEDSSNPAIALSDTGQTRDWFLVALGDGLGIRYADGGGSGSASNVTESAFFKNDGNVGIGTSDPHSSGANFSMLTLNGAKGGGIVFSDDDVNQHQIYSTDDGSLRFARGSGLSDESMRIDSNGNLGIGTSSPNNYANYNVLTLDGTNGGVVDLESNGTLTGEIYVGTNQLIMDAVGSSSVFRFQTNSTERMRIDSAGVVLMGSTATTFGGIDATRLAVVGGSNTSTNAVQMIVDEDGSVEGGSTLLAIGFSGDNSFSTANYINFFDSGGQQGRIEGAGAGSVAYQTSSDRRLKSNIRDTGSKWDALKQIQVRDYEWTADTSNKTVTGFIAQELHTIFPDAVSEGDEDVTKKSWAVDYGRTTPIIIKALQEAMAKIETLETKIAALEAN